MPFSQVNRRLMLGKSPVVAGPKRIRARADVKCLAALAERASFDGPGYTGGLLPTVG